MDNNAQCPVIFEEWRNINYGKVTPDMYEVSNCGRVRNIKSKVIIKPYITNSNYLEYHLFKDKKYRSIETNRYQGVTAHRLVLSTFEPVNDKSLTVNHIDGNHYNNLLCNLEWATQKENNGHSYRTGLNKNFGENAKNAILTDSQVRFICQVLQDHNYNTYSDILNMINITPTQNAQDMIGNIKRRISWKWISKHYTW